jgi:diguanylate cyclase (GGDEF)-like protein
LEQLNQFYDANITDSYFNLEESNQDFTPAVQQGLSQSQLNKFIQKLLTTIDLPKLADLYFQQLKNTLPMSGLKIQFEDNLVKFGESDGKKHQKTLKCMQHSSAVAVMEYDFLQPPSIRDWQILQQMHVNFCYPFKNALEHFKIKQFAMKDFLTSLGNRASYDETMVRLVSQSHRHHQPFGLLVLDMDNFKQVNDVHGHQEGDKVLIICAETILHCLRETDFAFRFGGDEFCCLLPDADKHTNKLIAERIRSAIEAQPLLRKHNISCSIGTATYLTNDSQIGIFSRADDALYTAKEAGKNCIKAA